MKKHLLFLLFILAIQQNIQSQEEFIGEVRMFAGNYAPYGWEICNGQTLPIANNQALFSLIGTTYGGDGIATFKLPDMRGRLLTHPNSNNLGEKGGSETNTLTASNLPPHSHSLTDLEKKASTLEANTTSSQSSNYAVSGTNAYSNTADTNMAETTVSMSNTGNGIPIDNVQPYISINFIICTQGIYPSRQ